MHLVQTRYSSLPARASAVRRITFPSRGGPQCFPLQEGVGAPALWRPDVLVSSSSSSSRSSRISSSSRCERQQHSSSSFAQQQQQKLLLLLPTVMRCHQRTGGYVMRGVAAQQRLALSPSLLVSARTHGAAEGCRKGCSHATTLGHRGGRGCTAHPCVVCAAARKASPTGAGSKVAVAGKRLLADVVALDVEFAHVVAASSRAAHQRRPPPDLSALPPPERLLPAMVCLVDRSGVVLYSSYIALPTSPAAVPPAVQLSSTPPTQAAVLPIVPPAFTQAASPPPNGSSSNSSSQHSPNTSAPRWRSVGGVPLALLQGAPSVAQVRAALQPLLSGCLVIGHGLSRDLAALGLLAGRPKELMLCTKTWPAFQGQGGTARSLKVLAERLLGRSIQQAGQRHDPEEDARAVMDLFVQHIEQRRAADLGYNALVEYHTRQMLRGLPLQQDDDCDGTDDDPPPVPPTGDGT